jgi:hypothetical protein
MAALSRVAEAIRDPKSAWLHSRSLPSALPVAERPTTVDFMSVPHAAVPQRSLLVPSLLAALAAVDVIAWPLAYGQQWPHPVLLLCYALAFSQMSLVAIWSALGRTHPLVRALVLIAAIGIGQLALSILHGHGEQWTILLSLQVASVAGPLLVARRLGVRIARDSGVEETRDVRPLQFTLGHLLGGLTAVAVVMGTARVVFPAFDSLRVLQEAAILGAAFAAIALLAVWAGLGAGRAWIRPLVLLSASVALGYGLTLAVYGIKIGPAITLAVLQAVLLGGWLAVFRMSGYQLNRHGIKRR